MVDEIYERIIYGGIKHFSIGSVPEVADRTITVNGLSKAFAMTGWRVGYAACPGEFGKALIGAMDTLQGQMTSCITSFVYPAIRAALTKAESDTESMREHFSRRAEAAFALAGRIPGVKTPRPTGAFYLFPDVSACYGKKTRGGRMLGGSVDFAEALLTEHHVASIPGVEFGGHATHRHSLQPIGAQHRQRRRDDPLAAQRRFGRALPPTTPCPDATRCFHRLAPAIP